MIGWIKYGDLAIVSSGRKAIKCNAEVEWSYAEPARRIRLHGRRRSLENLLAGKIEANEGE
jgi:hypothetical protein